MNREALPHAAAFEQARPRLFGLAYRMLGQAMEAEDVVQEAWLRWVRVAEGTVKSPDAFLITVVTRLCLDVLSAARTQREAYVGPWLPEPLVAEAPPDAAALSESLSMAFLVLLESLAPAERAAFLLREVFDYDYPAVARAVGRSEAACRQMVHRARERVRARRPRFAASPSEQEQLLVQFTQTCATGDLAGLLALLDAEVVLHSDGGGRVAAATRPILGADHVARFLLGLTRKIPVGMVLRFLTINGQLGQVLYQAGQPVNVLILEVADGRIRALFNVRNPDKLRAIPALEEV